MLSASLITGEALMSAQEETSMDALEPYKRKRRAEEEAEDATKRHKHKDIEKHRHHHRHHKHKHHHHHHKKHRRTETEKIVTTDGDGVEKEDDFRFVRVSANANEEKEEGEIVESEIESGEIQPEEANLILMGLNSAASKVSKKCMDQVPGYQDRHNEVEHEFSVFSEISDKNDKKYFISSVEDSDVGKGLIEKKKNVHVKDRNGRSDDLTGKVDTHDEITGDKMYSEIDEKLDKLDGNKMTIQRTQHRNQGSRLTVEDGRRQFGRNQLFSEETKAAMIRDDRKHSQELKDSVPKDDFKNTNHHFYNRHKKEIFSESVDINTQYGHLASGDSGKVQDNERGHHISDHNEEGYSLPLLKVIETESQRRCGHALSPLKDILQERHSRSPLNDIVHEKQHRRGHLESPLKYTERERRSIEEHSHSPLKDIDGERHLRQDFSSRSPPSKDSGNERHWQKIGTDFKEVTKDLKHYRCPDSSSVQQRLELKDDVGEKHRDSQYKERYHEKMRSKSQDINKNRSLGKARSRSPGSSGDKYWGRARSPSRDRYRERGQSPSRDQYRERGQSPLRDHYRERAQSPSRDCYRERVQSPSHDWYRERGRSPSHDRYRDKVSGRKRSRSREAKEIYSQLRERARWIHEEVRKRSRSREREIRHYRSSRVDSGRSRRSNSRDVSKAGRTDNRYDRHHRFGLERQSDRDRQRDRTQDKEHSSKHQESTHDAKEDKDKIREEENQEEYQERVTLQLAEQEEDDVEKIKEASRKRRQAILEKYKQQKLQSQVNEQGDQEVRKDGSRSSVDNLAVQNTVPTQMSIRQPEQITGLVDNGQDGSDIFVPDPTFSVGKEPMQNGIQTAERTLCTGGLGEGSPKSEVAADMFCDDIFGDSPARIRKPGRGDGLPVDTSGLHDNWDDAEGYYSYRIGEVLDGRYEIIAAHGKGVFSSVVRAKDLKAGKGEPEEVAIKIIRNNETMYKAGQEELVILKKLAGADPEDKRHCVRFLSSFKYRNHLCLVFESLNMNLREVLKKFGRNIGLKLTAVRAYAKQLFIALKHLKNCGVLHCDIKPDNMLVNEAKNVLKLCDFGNAMFAGKNEITPYLVSRFYRAPEIILGLPYDHAMDIWSVGCCLFELYLGKVLFPGPTNNDMLRLHMELKGPFPKKMLRKGSFTDQHFDQDLNFHATEEDPVSKKAVKRLLVNIKPKDIGGLFQSSPGEDPKMLSNFKDLLERIFILDPDKRLTVSQALSHPFITGK